VDSEADPEFESQLAKTLSPVCSECGPVEATQSVDSTLQTPLHSWCHFDSAVAGASRSPFGRAGSRIIEMSGSNEFNSVAQMDKKGK
jgi:hypothetical protein